MNSPDPIVLPWLNLFFGVGANILDADANQREQPASLRTAFFFTMGVELWRSLSQSLPEDQRVTSQSGKGRERGQFS